MRMQQKEIIIVIINDHNRIDDPTVIDTGIGIYNIDRNIGSQAQHMVANRQYQQHLTENSDISSKLKQAIDSLVLEFKTIQKIIKNYEKNLTRAEINNRLKLNNNKNLFYAIIPRIHLKKKL